MGDAYASGRAPLPDYTYIGSFDDKVQQYPWRFQPTLQVLNEQLITYALFGNPLLLNDGYFAANPQIHRSLLDGPESIVGALAQEGFVKLYMRDQGRDLISGIEEAAKTGVSDHRARLGDEEWKGNVRPFLEDLLPRLEWSTETWPAPDHANIGRAFYNLLKSRVDSRDLQLALEPGMLHDAFRCFDQEIDKSSYAAARTVWEQHAIPRFIAGLEGDHDPKALQSALMMLANEAYHIAQTLAASKKFVGKTCAVQTALSTAFRDLVVLEDQPRDLDTQKANARRYLFSPPDAIRITGSGLRALMYPRSGIGLMKRQYLDGLNAYLLGALDEEEMDRLFRAYQDDLAGHLAHYEKVGDMKSGFVCYALSAFLGIVDGVGGLLGAASSIGSATLFRWYRKNLISAQLERGRIEEMQNIPPEFRKGDPWRQSLMSVPLETAESFLTD